MRAKILALAAALLEAHAADLELTEATQAFDSSGAAFSGAVHVAAVEVDADTGRVSVRDYTVVEDCGPVINPMIVEGQIHGAVAQGIGEALGEELVYDDLGQLVTGTLMDYPLPVASALPSFAIGHLETPSPHTPGGVKGMGRAAPWVPPPPSPTRSPTPFGRSVCWSPASLSGPRP